ncbi:indole-3-glycerol phosphate synthase TrpC [Alicyclobacillaceae bacterium I2511]|nr:indole-3-glycerol phosphate synthase TrpC [Alicyclobacillaceae bacterium I2511]
MNEFLNRILLTKEAEVAQLRTRDTQGVTVELSNLPPCRGFLAQLETAPQFAVIAEVKKASPSKGLIQPDFNPVKISQVYATAGAQAISVLTDETYFQGSMADLTAVHEAVGLPILRKDFIIDERQIDQARIAGADAILLICAVHTAKRLSELSEYAQFVGLDVLIEVHQVSEVATALAASPAVLGINNRDLHTFRVSLEVTREVIKEIPPSVFTIAESGIRSREDALRMAQYGVRGVLVGESLMRAGTPSQVAALLRALQKV